jgi:hypothetical protein
MNVASVDKNKAPWVISTADQPPALEIVLRRQTVIISWNQFVYAEGGEDEVRIAFASHDVAVKGAGLDPLLRETPSLSLRLRFAAAASRNCAIKYFQVNIECLSSIVKKTSGVAL